MPLHYYHRVWLVLIFGWISNYMVRVALSPVLLPLMKEFSLSYAQAGLLASAVFYSYALMQFPAGYLGDRFGKKRILILCILGWGLSSLAMAAAASFAALVLVRFLTGLAQGTYFSNDRPIIAYYTPKEKAGIGQGISFMGLGLGMCLGILLAGWISDHWGWRAVFLIFSLPSLAAAYSLFRVIREPPREAIVSGKPKGPSLSWIFRHRDLWLLYLGGIPGIYALWMIGTWAPAMLKEIGVRTVTGASLYASLLGLSAIPGLALTGWLSDRLVRRGKGPQRADRLGIPDDRPAAAHLRPGYPGALGGLDHGRTDFYYRDGRLGPLGGLLFPDLGIGPPIYLRDGFRLHQFHPFHRRPAGPLAHRVDQGCHPLFCLRLLWSRGLRLYGGVDPLFGPACFSLEAGDSAKWFIPRG